MTGALVALIMLAATLLSAPVTEVATYLRVVGADQLDEASMRWVLERAGWDGERLEEALAVSWCESRWQPGARNGIMLGLFQLWDGWFAWGGIDIEQWRNPLVNAMLARRVYEHRGRWGGAGGWSCTGGN